MNRRFVPALVLVPFGLLAACTENDPASAGGSISVVSTDSACTVSRTEAVAGNLVFDVKNAGSQVTEFYLLAGDGLRIVGEVENIGPGLTRQMVVAAGPGEYLTACKPGMVGDGIRAPFSVTGEAVVAPAGQLGELLATATEQYALYVEEQAEELIEKTTEFAALYVAGDDGAARALYADARTHWERIEPVAESFGDLDPRLDLREADLAEGEAWTGWHRIEKDLWPEGDPAYTAATQAEREALAEQLVADTNELGERVDELTFSADQLGNGAKELLDEVATGKVTGEEEIWSHTDLWDFQANVDGARIAFEVLQPALLTKDAALSDLLAERFAELQELLDQYRDGDGFVLYTELTADQVKELSDAVNALSEPLSNLTAAVVL
ncbi:MAG: iron uptake system protein EfeO [Actinomycetota bacterium]|nr:iron uptake system protein EfeO [Actinomycetota bacterium]